MFCPQCQTNNVSGKKFCVKCGFEFHADQRSQGRSSYSPALLNRYGPNKGPKKRRGFGALLLIILLLAVAVVAYQTTRIPEEVNKELPKLSENEAQKADLKFRNLAFYGKKGDSLREIATVAELNNLISNDFDTVKKYLRQDTIAVDDMRLDIVSDNIQLIFRTYVKFKHIYVCLTGKIKKRGDKIYLVPTKVAIGKLKLPLETAPTVAKLIRETNEPLVINLPGYVTDLKIEKGQLVITIGAQQ